MMMSSGKVLAQSNRQSCRRKIGLCSEGRLSRKRAGEEKRDRRLESLYGWSIQPSFSVLEGGISKGDEGWNVCPMPLLGDASLPTQLGLAVVLRVLRGRFEATPIQERDGVVKQHKVKYTQKVRITS